MNESINDFGPRAEDGAINVYRGDSADEFPVLKAFQQYIDAEQAKARKRLVLICVFFSFILTIVIGVFVILLLFASSRAQALNDRMVEYVMKDREHDRERNAAVAPPRDDSAMQSLSRRLEDISKTLEESRHAAAVKATEEAAMKKASVETVEIERLKILLAAEKEKTAAEREKARQAELEAYRRKHYPELYETKTIVRPKTGKSRKIEEEAEEADREIESIIKDMEAINYFDESDSEDEMPAVRRTENIRKTPVKAKDAPATEVPVKKTAVDDGVPIARPKENGASPSGKGAAMQNSVKVSTGTWDIPQDPD